MTVDVHLELADDRVRKLHTFAQQRGLTETAVIEKALDLLFGLDDISCLADYDFSLETMREDWDAMPDDWMATDPEVSDVVPAR